MQQLAYPAALQIVVMPLRKIMVSNLKPKWYRKTERTSKIFRLYPFTWRNIRRKRWRSFLFLFLFLLRRFVQWIRSVRHSIEEENRTVSVFEIDEDLRDVVILFSSGMNSELSKLGSCENLSWSILKALSQADWGCFIQWDHQTTQPPKTWFLATEASVVK